MARYIDADFLIEQLQPAKNAEWNKNNYSKSISEMIEDFCTELKNTRTADVVEVVRCKDCIYKTVTEDGEYNPEDIVCEYHMSDGFDSDDYCSFGKRKVDE